MKSSNKNFINFLAFLAICIVAMILFVENLLPVVGVEIAEGKWLWYFINALKTVNNIFTAIILGISAYKFAADRPKWVKIIFWVVVAIFVVATVLIWL